MFRKKNRSKKRTRAMLSAYSIIMILVILLGILSNVLPRAQYAPIVDGDVDSAVEVGPGEWEGEMPAGGEAGLRGEPTALEGDLTEAPEPMEKNITREMAPEAEPAETVGEAPVLISEEVTVDKEAVTEEVAATTEVYNSKAECEEAYGEDGCAIVDGSGVEGAALYQILIAPILGFEDAIDIGIFIMVLGGLLAVVAKTKALETGIKILVKKLHGKEYLLILLLMFIFSILGTTYGFLEESVGFYVLIAATMFAAGLDPLVGVGTILLGAGSGVLGSTINPFATGVVLAAMKDAGIEYSQATVILIAVVLWLTTLAISAFFVIMYAKKVQRDKGSTFLSLREQAAAEKKYGKYLETHDEEVKLSGKQIATLIVFALTFIVMIVGFIPWGEFKVYDSSTGELAPALINNIAVFLEEHTGWLTGTPLGEWWFYEAALWFLICAIIIAIINRQGEHGFVDTFIDGADDMIGVILVIAVARGASVLMSQTALDNFIVVNAANWLASLPPMAFVPLNYLLHTVLSILVPSSSGLATLSTPIIAPVASKLGYSTNVTAMTIVAANGMVNLITPTCGAIMGGLALAKVDYATWFKWGIRVVACIAVVNIVILCLFSI